VAADAASGSGFAQRAQQAWRGAAYRSWQGRQTTPSQPSPHSAQVDGSRRRSTAIGQRWMGRLSGRDKRKRLVIGSFPYKPVHSRHYLI
jgi:hypothetical protein